MSFYLPNKLFFYTKNKKKISISLFYKLVVFPINSVTRKPRQESTSCGLYVIWHLIYYDAIISLSSLLLEKAFINTNC